MYVYMLQNINSTADFCFSYGLKVRNQYFQSRFSKFTEIILADKESYILDASLSLVFLNVNFKILIPRVTILP